MKTWKETVLFLVMVLLSGCYSNFSKFGQDETSTIFYTFENEKDHLYFKFDSLWCKACDKSLVTLEQYSPIGARDKYYGINKFYVCPKCNKIYELKVDLKLNLKGNNK